MFGSTKVVGDERLFSPKANIFFRIHVHSKIQYVGFASVDGQRRNSRFRHVSHRTRVQHRCFGRKRYEHLRVMRRTQGPEVVEETVAKDELALWRIDYDELTACAEIIDKP